MKKHKRIKALPVCSSTLKEKCAIYQYCLNHKCGKNTTCAAAELINNVYRDVYGNEGKCTLVNCRCAEFQYSGIGCPLFRKVGE